MSTLKPIPEFEGLYSITSDGRVWSHPRAWINVNGQRCSHGGMWMKTPLISSGYPVVNLTKDRKSHLLLVHRLVASAWLADSRRSEHTEVNHKNGVRNDPRAENLEWVTRSENKRHAYRTGITKITDRQRAHASEIGRGRRVLSPEQVDEIRGGKHANCSFQKIAAHYGVGRETVRLLVRGITYLN